MGTASLFRAPMKDHLLACSFGVYAEIYDETAREALRRTPPLRSALLREIVDAAFPDLWASLVAEKALFLRAGSTLPTARGYLGMTACAWHPETCRLLALALAQSMGRTIEGPWGTVRIARIGADERADPRIRKLRRSDTRGMRVLGGPVTLVTRTPLHRSTALLEELRDAAQTLAPLLAASEGTADLHKEAGSPEISGEPTASDTAAAPSGNAQAGPKSAPKAARASVRRDRHPENAADAFAPFSAAPDACALSGALPWRVEEIRLRPCRAWPEHRVGSVTLGSDLPGAGILLDYALLRGFGPDRADGFGTLEPA